jgi:adenylosuccinate lyase
MAELFDATARANTIVLDICRDISDVHLPGLLQAEAEGRRDRLVRPCRKVNPSTSRTAEGNLGLANGVLRHLADKLPVSACSAT